MRLNRADALRYMGAQGADQALRAALEEMAALLEARVTPRFIWREYAVETAEGGALLRDAGLLLPGEMAKRMLSSCRAAALLLCTLGAGFDALLRTWERRDMARAVMLDACASAYAEAGCDAAEEEIRAAHPGLYLTDRFSPSYGDLPLALQDDFLRLLAGEKRLGVQAADSHLLLPVKSVTAVIGLADTPQRALIRGCAFCALKENCAFRERGTSCAV